VFEPLIELGTDTTRTIASLLFSGSAERFPDVKWIFSHAGGTAPFLMQRFTYYFAARKDLQPRLPKGPAYYLERFYYDTANAMTIHPLASLHQTGEADANCIRDRFSVLDGEGHRSGSARGRPVQCYGLAGD
jgi:predicted TIM-barrel fold metal-dependent hydrolase